MKELLMSNRDVLVIVDDEDYERLSKFKWQINKEGDTIQRLYETRSITKAGFIKIKQNHVALANEIMCRFGVTFDHEDRNYLNNRKSNLREATRSQNGANREKFSGKYYSKYKGVSWHKRQKKWVGSIKFNGKNIYLGQSDNELDIAKAYNKAALEFFKEFACLNKNEKGEVL